MQPQDNQPNSNPAVSPTPATPPTPTPQTASAPTTEMSTQTSAANTPTPVAEPAVKPGPESIKSVGTDSSTASPAVGINQSKKPNNKTKLFLIIGIVLALILIGALWFFLFR